MAKTTGFRKVRSGGVDQGDLTLNRFGMVPIVQKSPGVSAIGQFRIGVVPDDGADILEILTMVDIAVTTAASTFTLDFGTSADTSAFGVIEVSGIGRYALPLAQFTPNALTVIVSGSRYTVASAGQHILVTVASGSASPDTPPGFISYITYLQPLADS